MAEERCAACRRLFDGHSKPRWAFTLDGIPAGRVHATCATRVSDPFLRGAPGDSFDDAHFFVWTRYVRVWGEDPAAWDLQGLVHHPTEVLSPEQEKHLDWWLERGKRSPVQIEALKTAHTALVREFWTWRAGLGGC